MPSKRAFSIGPNAIACEMQKRRILEVTQARLSVPAIGVLLKADSRGAASYMLFSLYEMHIFRLCRVTVKAPLQLWLVSRTASRRSSYN